MVKARSVCQVATAMIIRRAVVVCRSIQQVLLHIAFDSNNHQHPLGICMVCCQHLKRFVLLYHNLARLFHGLESRTWELMERKPDDLIPLLSMQERCLGLTR